MEQEDSAWDKKAPVLSHFRPKDEHLYSFDMLQDKERNLVYSQAIRLLTSESSERVGNTTDGDRTDRLIHRWLDIGTGSGLLAGLVARSSRASALTAEVYACEGVQDVADVAAKTFQNGGWGVHMHHKHSTELEIGKDIPLRMSRVVSELLGTGLLDEGVLPTMRDAKARLLTPDFVSIPSSAEVWAFCCESSELERMSRLSPPSTAGVRAPSSEAWQCCPGTSAPASLHVRSPQWGGIGYRPLSKSVKVFDFDFADVPGPDGREIDLHFPADVSGTVNAVVCWWRCFLDKDRTVVMNTSPAGQESSSKVSRDHWRQAVYVMHRPVHVKAGNSVRTVARHDDVTIWFGTLEATQVRLSPSERDAHRSTGLQKTNSSTRYSTASPKTVTKSLAGDKSQTGEQICGHRGAVSVGIKHQEETAVDERSGAYPPVCVCGLHRTCSPYRVWMLNDEQRIAAFRSAIKAVMDDLGAGEELRGDVTPRSRRSVIACISDGFFLPIIAAQEGASDILSTPPSATSEALYRVVYRANGISDETIRVFSGGFSSFYEILSPPPGSPSVYSEVGKIDVVLGEPFFADLSSTWPMESLMLFWCVRTALEGYGCFSPRTRFVPARARLLACAFSCELLFRGRRRVGIVEGIDMSAVNDGLGCSWKPNKVGENSVAPQGENSDPSTQGQDIESVRLAEYPHELLSRPTAILDLDMSKPLCDLHGGIREIRCGNPEGLAPSRKKEDAVCHGVVLWLDIWLDENGVQRLSTGLDTPYWPQGLLFFEEGWVVPPSRRSFNLQANLVDGHLKLNVS